MTRAVIGERIDLHPIGGGGRGDHSPGGFDSGKRSAFGSPTATSGENAELNSGIHRHRTATPFALPIVSRAAQPKMGFTGRIRLIWLRQ